MTDLLDHFDDDTLAVIFGAAGLASQLTWPLLRTRNAILTLQLGMAASYATQYGLMDAWSGMVVCTIGACQALVALLAGNRPWLPWLGAVFLPLVAAISFVTWSGASSAFALTACCLVMTGRMQRDTLRMRYFLLAASPFGIAYDMSVGAAPALVGACVSACIGLAALRREISARRRAPGFARALTA